MASLSATIQTSFLSCSLGKDKVPSREARDDSPQFTKFEQVMTPSLRHLAFDAIPCLSKLWVYPSSLTFTTSCFWVPLWFWLRSYLCGCWLGSWAISCAQGASAKIYNGENLADMEIKTGLAGCWPRSWWLSSNKVVVLIAGFYLSLIMWTFCESCALQAVNLLLESLLQIKSHLSKANKALH